MDAVLAASRSLIAVATVSLGAAAEETTLAQYRALVVMASRGPQRLVDPGRGAGGRPVDGGPYVRPTGPQGTGAAAPGPLGPPGGAGGHHPGRTGGGRPGHRAARELIAEIVARLPEPVQRMAADYCGPSLRRPARYRTASGPPSRSAASRDQPPKRAEGHPRIRVEDWRSCHGDRDTGCAAWAVAERCGDRSGPDSGPPQRPGRSRSSLAYLASTGRTAQDVIRANQDSPGEPGGAGSGGGRGQRRQPELSAMPSPARLAIQARRAARLLGIR